MKKIQLTIFFQFKYQLTENKKLKKIIIFNYKKGFIDSQ